MDRDTWLDTVLPRLLPGFLPHRRWFGSKARTIRDVELLDAVWLPDPPGACALVVTGVRYGDGGHERYAMLLAFVADPAGLPVVGRADALGAEWVVEAATHARAVLALLRGFGVPRDARTLRGGTLHYGDAGPAALEMLGTQPRPVPAVQPAGTEQSNTSVRLDRTLVFKLIRRIDYGENPELEVGRFLTARTTFRAMSGLQGSLTYVSPSGEASTIGVLQDWIDNRGDGWSYVVSALGQPVSAQQDSLARDLHALGRTTADFHAALASDATDAAFAPEPATAIDVEAWQTALVTRASRTLGLVERHVDTWPGDARRLGRSLLDLEGGAAALSRVADRAAAEAGFHKIRVHGDYHLGQTLKTADTFAIIDFEGEPARSLAERRLKHCALKDVAGMIRSFDYAIETARAGHGGGEPWARERLREPFLDGYLSMSLARGVVFLPDDRRAIDAWIDFFELEKALYEVDYEINNRPAWVHIPLHGMLRILRAQD